MVELWFAILTLMLAGYAVMDGWNIGCGVAQFLVAKSPAERRLVISAIGPLWTWHEVWLVASGGVLFVAFPGVLAVALPGFYLAVFVLLWCMVGRGLSLEFGGHIDDPLWRTFWDVAFSVVNLLIALLLGVALGNIVRGVPAGATGKFSLAFFTDFRTRGEVGILDWYTGCVAVFTVVCVAAHGASYLVWKTEGRVHDRSLALARRLWLAVFVAHARDHRGDRGGAPRTVHRDDAAAARLARGPARHLRVDRDRGRPAPRARGARLPGRLRLHRGPPGRRRGERLSRDAPFHLRRSPTRSMPTRARSGARASGSRPSGGRWPWFSPSPISSSSSASSRARCGWRVRPRTEPGRSPSPGKARPGVQ